METEARPRTRVGRTEMDFQHQGKILTAVHPFYGPASSLNLLRQIRGSPESLTGFREPTAPELVSFVHKYFNSNEPQAREVNQIMKDRYFRGFTGILYLPKDKVAHFIDHPEFDQNSVVDKDNLLKRLAESRAQVSFKHLKKGYVSWKEVKKHPYFVAWAGSEEGAEKLAELTSKHPNKEAYIFVPVSNLSESVERVAALGPCWDGLGLLVSSYYLGDGEGSCAFGILNKIGEAGLQKS